MNKAILAKIRKCLALSASANEHEAVAALAKAKALMAENGIDDAFLSMADIEEHAARGSRAQRPPLWESLLCATVRRAMSVDVILDQKLDRRYIGRGARPEVAAYAFLVLHRQLKRARRTYIETTLRRCKAARKRVRADIFCEGWASAVFRKIAALYPEHVDPEVGQYLGLTHPDLVPVKVWTAEIKGQVANEDWWRGRARGSDVDLHQGMGSARAPLMLA
jgi:Protein of unknown function (DUF2786)